MQSQGVMSFPGILAFVHGRVGRAIRSVGRRITRSRRTTRRGVNPRGGLMGQFRRRQARKARDLNRFR